MVVLIGSPATGSPLREHAPVAVLAGDREQLAARLAGEPHVEGLLEAAYPREAAVGKSEPRQLARRHLLRRADLAGDVERRDSQGRASGRGRALGERGPVTGEDRGALGHVLAAVEGLPGLEAGEDELRLPGDRLAVHRERDLALDVAVGMRGDGHRDLDHVAARAPLGLLCVTGRDRVHGRRDVRVVVGALELLLRVGRGGLVAELGVHRVVVLRLPGVGEALRRLAAGRRCADRDAGDEGDHAYDHYR